MLTAERRLWRQQSNSLWSKTGKKGIVATTNSFHGKTLGALSATGNTSYQKAFGAPVEGFRFVPYGDSESLEQLLAAEADQIAAVILEPIQGEGGIVEPPAGYLAKVRALCTQYDVLLIFDEIQTGLGRTGVMFAGEAEGVTCDLMTLAKALGGGLFPIGAVLCTDEVYTEEFAMKHSSTFAGNTIACRVGAKVVDLLTENDQYLVKEAARKGNILKAGLEQIQAKYPDIIKGVRGRGLMLGLDFGNTRDPYPNSLIGIMAEQKVLTPIIASHLLNVGKVRVAPTLTGASVIRIEPPLVISDEQIALALEAIEGTVKVLAQRNTAALTAHLLPVDLDLDYRSEQADVVQPAAAPKGDLDEGRFAFLVHPLNMKTTPIMIAAWKRLLRAAERTCQPLDRYAGAVCNFKCSDYLSNRKSAYGDFIVVPYTAAELQQMPRETAEAKILAAVELAVEREQNSRIRRLYIGCHWWRSLPLRKGFGTTDNRK